MNDEEMRGALQSTCLHADWCHELDRSPWFPCACQSFREEFIEALLPTVRRIAASELRTAADDMPGKPGTNPAQDWLLNRAAALDGTA